MKAAVEAGSGHGIGMPFGFMGGSCAGAAC